MKTILLLLFLMLSGCAMSNDDIIAETKKCEDAGMIAVPHYNGFTERIVVIQCAPCREERK